MTDFGKDFEPLREMGAFTENMFNRIIAFQEKEHPAWKTDLPFEQRIAGLPLHNLIFSNPDRDPAKSGPTVAAFYPLREELQKIAHYILAASNDTERTPILCDLFPGNGFVGSLLGREGLDVIGCARGDQKPGQITAFFDDQCFRYTDAALTDLTFDAALVPWPPAGVNPTPELLACRPKLIVYIYTEHQDESTAAPQTGSAKMFDGLDEHYRELDAWTVTRPKDLLHEIWPDMTPSIEETRQVRIFVDRSLPEITVPPSLPPTQAYDWEKDLQMALLARQAKQQLQARGFPTD